MQYSLVLRQLMKTGQCVDGVSLELKTTDSLEVVSVLRVAASRPSCKQQGNTRRKVQLVRRTLKHTQTWSSLPS